MAHSHADLRSAIQLQAARMQNEFKEIRDKYRVSTDIGQETQWILLEFLRKYLPPVFGLGVGEILDTYGNRSGQVDIVVANQYHPFTYSESRPGLFFVEGVSLAIEVKSALRGLDDLETALKQSQGVKKLRRRHLRGTTALMPEEYGPIQIERPISVVFTFHSANIATLLNNVKECVSTLQIPVEEQFDCLVSLDKGIIHNIKHPKDPLVIEVGGQRRTGIIGVETGVNTLFCFLYYVSHTIPKVAILDSIIAHYLDPSDLAVRIY